MFLLKSTYFFFEWSNHRAATQIWHGKNLFPLQSPMRLTAKPPLAMTSHSGDIYLVSGWRRYVNFIQINSTCIACHILLGLLTLLFQSTWEQCNIIKHGNTCVVARTERNALLLDIHEWKWNDGARLEAAQIYLVDYNDETIQTWSNQHLTRMLNLCKPNFWSGEIYLI